MQTLQQLLAGKLKGNTKLKLSCGLTEFPEEIFDLADTLEYLDLSGNRLRKLPDDLGRLKKLKIVFCSDNDFTELPPSLSQCPTLDIIGFKANKIESIAEGTLPRKIRWLILTNNRLDAIPCSIGACTNMQKLMLSGNKISKLPAEMVALQKLELLRISANEISAIPSWLFSLPRLSWLAFAGNPCNTFIPDTIPLPEIDWQNLILEALIGEGASGEISRALWQNNEQKKTIAAKVFKGEVTSDGLPSDEMTACIAAGHHDNIVQVLGKISNHPQRRHGLILELIPPAYTNLGGPPDFKTCTRDTFTESTRFTLPALLRIAQGIAAAATHLHSRGIMHGDLYAHNILINETSHPLLGDFGAATIYDRTDFILARSLELIEVRAFGCLLEDLLDHLDLSNTKPFLNAITILKNDCMNEAVSLRPDFSEIVERLKPLAVESESKPIG